MAKPKEKTLKRKLDELHSKIVRRGEADERGNITCYCGAVVPWQESDCSHFVARGCLNLRYSFKNTKASCRRCNRFMGGNLHAYALYLEEKYGQGILQELEREKRTIVKNYPYSEKIEEYQEKLRELDLRRL